MIEVGERIEILRDNLQCALVRSGEVFFVEKVNFRRRFIQIQAPIDGRPSYMFGLEMENIGWKKILLT